MRAACAPLLVVVEPLPDWVNPGDRLTLDVHLVSDLRTSDRLRRRRRHRELGRRRAAVAVRRADPRRRRGQGRPDRPRRPGHARRTGDRTRDDGATRTTRRTATRPPSPSPSPDRAVRRDERTDRMVSLRSSLERVAGLQVEEVDAVEVDADAQRFPAVDLGVRIRSTSPPWTARAGPTVTPRSVTCTAGASRSNVTHACRSTTSVDRTLPTSWPSGSRSEGFGPHPERDVLSDEPAPERTLPELRHRRSGSGVGRPATPARWCTGVASGVRGDDRGPDHVHRRCAHELGDEEIARMVVHLDRDPTLLDPPAAHHREAIAHGHRLVVIVGHVQRRDPEAPLHAGDDGRVWVRSFASRCDMGSSIRSTRGLRTIARPSAVR